MKNVLFLNFKMRPQKYDPLSNPTVYWGVSQKAD